LIDGSEEVTVSIPREAVITSEKSIMFYEIFVAVPQKAAIFILAAFRARNIRSLLCCTPLKL
jgi:hypothetical protein